VKRLLALAFCSLLFVSCTTNGSTSGSSARSNDVRVYYTLSLLGGVQSSATVTYTTATGLRTVELKRLPLDVGGSPSWKSPIYTVPEGTRLTMKVVVLRLPHSYDHVQCGIETDGDGQMIRSVNSTTCVVNGTLPFTVEAPPSS
jgi:hypothetical protein